MPTAVVVYRSATGTTRGLAEEIGAHLEARGVATTVRSVGDADPASLAGEPKSRDGHRSGAGTQALGRFTWATQP